jgi:hypothetical protein
MSSGRCYFVDQLHVSALYRGHHQVGIINVIGNYRNDPNHACILYSEVFLNLTEVFLTLTAVFPCFFLSCKANARVKLAQTGHSTHSSTLVVICVVRLLFVLFYHRLFVNVCCHRVTTQLQLINTEWPKKIYTLYSSISLE